MITIIYLRPTTSVRARKTKQKAKEKPHPKPTSKSARSALKTNVREVHTDSDDDTGGLSEYDERDGDERQHAVDSPPKNGQRATSNVSWQAVQHAPFDIFDLLTF